MKQKLGKLYHLFPSRSFPIFNGDGNGFQWKRDDLLERDV